MDDPTTVHVLRTYSGAQYEQYIKALKIEDKQSKNKSSEIFKQLTKAPLFSWSVLKSTGGTESDEYETDLGQEDWNIGGQRNSGEGVKMPDSHNDVPIGSPFPQYGLLGHEPDHTLKLADSEGNIDPIFLNTNTPFSAFICGVQGSGKSHTLSCMLENCLLPKKFMAHYGLLPKPLSGIVFNYDNFSSSGPCEAAFLSSAGVPVNVLVSPSNVRKMTSIYTKDGNLGKNINISPLKFQPKHLNAERMLKLMAFNDKSGPLPLYMEVIIKELRQMASKGTSDFNYPQFKEKIGKEGFTKDQKVPLNLRLELLESFMTEGNKNLKFDPFKTEPGTLTIVDLTDPFIDPTSACALFDICLSLFLENPPKNGRVVALDEAHKYLSNGEGVVDGFTSSLLYTIREQRHNATRVIIATQEPTVSPKLLDLCSMSIIHGFSSPAWFNMLQGHLGGASDLVSAAKNDKQKGQSAKEILGEILALNTGEALLFAPSAILGVQDDEFKKLGVNYIKFKTRPRASADGGESKFAVQG